MKHIVQFSGGLASAYVAKMVVDEFGKNNTILLFHDTKVEHPDNKKFGEDVCNYIGCDMIEVSDGRDLWELIRKNNTLPSNFIPFCTRILKQEQGKKFIAKHFKNERVTLYNGFGTHEVNRVNSAKKYETDKIKICSYLYDNNITDKMLTDIIVNEWKLKIADPYLKGFSHSNCLPCFKGGQKHFKMVYQYYPEYIEKVVWLEQITGHTVFKKVKKIKNNTGELISKETTLIPMTQLIKKWDEELNYKPQEPILFDEEVSKVNDSYQLEFAF